MKEKNEILALADFMGIQLSRHPNHEHDGKWWYRVDEPYEWDIWQPDKDLNQAFAVVREIRKRTGWGFELSILESLTYAEFHLCNTQKTDYEPVVIADAKTENQAILTACLQAIKEIEPQGPIRECDIDSEWATNHMNGDALCFKNPEWRNRPDICTKCVYNSRYLKR